jgi:hypothetical protein
MADLIQMQHVTKGPAGFTHNGTSLESDDDGFISVPAPLTGEAKSHGFTTDIAEKPAPKLLRKDAKADDSDKKLVKEDASKAPAGGSK